MPDLTELQKIFITVFANLIVLGIFGTISYYLRRDNQSVMNQLQKHDAKIQTSEIERQKLGFEVTQLRKDVDTLQEILSKIVEQGQELKTSHAVMCTNQQNNTTEVKNVKGELKLTLKCLDKILISNDKQNDLMAKFFRTQ